MTVNELIKELLTLPQNARVQVSISESTLKEGSFKYLIPDGYFNFDDSLETVFIGVW
jgi:hypothetical protein